MKKEFCYFKKLLVLFIPILLFIPACVVYFVYQTTDKQDVVYNTMSGVAISLIGIGYIFLTGLRNKIILKDDRIIKMTLSGKKEILFNDISCYRKEKIPYYRSTAYSTDLWNYYTYTLHSKSDKNLVINIDPFFQELYEFVINKFPECSDTLSEASIKTVWDRDKADHQQ